MHVDLSSINLTDRQTLVLRNLDGTAVQTLGTAFNIKASLYFNETSTIEFDVPFFANGVVTPNYHAVVGGRVVEWVGVGQFILVNPKITNEGIREIKHCTAYSLEYEWTKKKITMSDEYYARQFWNPVEPKETILGVILSYFPSWHVGYVDPVMQDVYRVLTVTNDNVYDFVKSTVQPACNCVFDFETITDSAGGTHERYVNVYAADSVIPTSNVWISNRNLAKEIELTEDTEAMRTVLDVNGADGVSIMSVNPMGTNKIYNLDYFMNTGYFSQALIDKWNGWKTLYESKRLEFYNLTIEQMLKTSAILTEEQKLVELRGVDLAILENRKSVYNSNLSGMKSPTYRHADATYDPEKHYYRHAFTELVSLKDAWDSVWVYGTIADTQLSEGANAQYAITNELTTMYHGNVDLTNRAIISAKTLYMSGDPFRDDFLWVDFHEGGDEYATLYSYTYTLQDYELPGTEVILVTPIYPNGKTFFVYAEDLWQYVGTLVNPQTGKFDASRDTRGIVLGIFDSGVSREDSIAMADYYAYAAHEANQAFDEGYRGSQFKNAIATLKNTGHALEDLTMHDYGEIFRTGGTASSIMVTRTSSEYEPYEYNPSTWDEDYSSLVYDEYRYYEDKIAQTTSAIEAMKDVDLRELEAELDALRASKDAITAQLVAITRAVNFLDEDNTIFTSEEKLLLDRYFTEDAIEESSFVYSDVENYSNQGASSELTDASCTITGAVTKIGNRTLYSVRSGTVQIPAFGLNARINQASVEMNDDHTGTICAYLLRGADDNAAFAGGSLSIHGTFVSVTDDTAPDLDAPDAYSTGTTITISGVNGHVYYTKDVTEYQKRSVDWDLYEYGRECLRKLAWPSYQFSVSSANFFALDEFAAFAHNVEFGQKIYLQVREDEAPLEPILIGVSLDLEDPSSLTLEFGDSYCSADGAFSLVDLLDKSISMGKKLDTSKFSYNQFIESGAATTVKQYMDSSLDVSKNSILSSKNMAISWDDSGLFCRKWNDSKTAYDDSQIAIVNNKIVFTGDNWQSAYMAIGEFEDKNTGISRGIVAPNIVGTLLAGSNLVIESAKQDGGVAVFRVDGNGALLHNSKFDIVKGNDQNGSHILLDPEIGFGIGDYPLVDPDTGTWDEDKAQMWYDLDEQKLHVKGEIRAGSLLVGSDQTGWQNVLTNDGKFSRNFLDLGQLTIDGQTGRIIWTSESSPVVAKYNSSSGGDISTWHDDWRSTDYFVRYSYDGGETWTPSIKIRGTDGVSPSLPGYIQRTYIDATQVASCNIFGNDLYANYGFYVAELTQSGGSVERGTIYGHVGYATGSTVQPDGTTIETYGIALTAGNGPVSTDTAVAYVITTNYGVRMQCGPHSSIALWNNVAKIDANYLLLGAASYGPVGGPRPAGLYPGQIYFEY